MQQPTASSATSTATQRIAPLDRARTLLVLLVLLHHSVLNYTYFGRGDRARWLGFDLIVLFNDSFFMAAMFFISGLFVAGSLARRGSPRYLRGRAWRLGTPFLLSIFVLNPIAYYPSFLRYHMPGTTDFSFTSFWWRTLTVGPWPSGPAWFLWVLLTFGALAAAVWSIAPRAIHALGRHALALRDRPYAALAMVAALTVAVYVPARLQFGESHWLAFGPIAVQTSRILLYASYFCCGIAIGATDLRRGLLAEDGAIARRWPVWIALALVPYGAILGLVYVRYNWLLDISDPPRAWQVAYGIALACFSAAMTVAVPAFFLRLSKANWRWLDALQPSAYGIFLLHYIFIIWTQYAVYDPPLPAGVKFAIVFAVTLSLSWLLTATLRRIPVVARLI